MWILLLPALAAPPQPQAIGAWWHSCSIVDGQVWCWGNDTYGQLGDGVRNDTSSPPARVGTLSDAVALGSGTFHTCALRRTGRTVCWGSNSYGQLGEPGEPGTTWAPTEVPIDDVVQVVGGGYHTLWLTRDGRVWQAGHGSSGTSSVTLPPIVEVAAGEGASVARDANGFAWSWTVKRPKPVDMKLGGVVQVAAHRDNACARTDVGHVLCWGTNKGGRLGDGTETPSAVPIDTGVRGATELWAGGGGFCARTPDGAMCWGGDPYGGLGDGSTDVKVRPRPAPQWDGGTPMHTSNGFHSCIVRDEDMQCWGFNWGGQLGNGRNQPLTSPTQVSGLPGVPQKPPPLTPTFDVAIEQNGVPVPIDDGRAALAPGPFTLVFRLEERPYIMVHADRSPLPTDGLFGAARGMAEGDGNPEGALHMKGAAAFHVWNEGRMDAPCIQGDGWTCRRTVRQAPEAGELHLVLGTGPNDPRRRLVLTR